MRKYTLASHDAKGTVDLRQYRKEIAAAVHEFMPHAQVWVEKDCYMVTPTPERGAAIRIGRRLCKEGLGKYCVKIPKLFCSEEVEEKKEVAHERKPKQKCLGGHQ